MSERQTGVTGRPRPTRLRSAARRAFDLGGASNAPLLVLFGLNIVDEFDRIAFAALTPEIRDAFALSDQQVVAIGSLSAVFVLLAALPIGYLADRTTRVSVVRWAAVLWAVMSVLTGLAWAVPILFAARFLAGLSKSASEVVHISLLADYYQPAVHPRVFQVHRLANSLAIVGSLLAGGIGAALGWRWAFFLLAVPTIALISSTRRLSEPDRGASIDPVAAAIAASIKPPTFRETRRRLFAIKSLRRLWCGFFAIGFSLLAFTQILSLFFEETYGFGPLARGAQAFAFGVASAVGLVIGGQIGTKLTMRGDTTSLVKLVAAGLCVFASGVALMALSPWWPGSLLFGSIGNIGLGVSVVVFTPISIRLVDPRMRGQTTAYTSVVLAMGGLFAIPLTGVADSIGYRVAFLALTPCLLLAAAATYSSARHVPGDIANADATFAEVAKLGVQNAPPPSAPQPRRREPLRADAFRTRSQHTEEVHD